MIYWRKNINKKIVYKQSPNPINNSRKKLMLYEWDIKNELLGKIWKNKVKNWKIRALMKYKLAKNHIYLYIIRLGSRVIQILKKCQKYIKNQMQLDCF